MLRAMAPSMNIRDKAIIDWAKKHRPDILDHLEGIREEENRGNERARGMYFLLIIGFEAGRKFQAENTALPLDNPSLYLNVSSP